MRGAGLVPDLLVPLGQALVTGGLLAGAAVVIVASTNWGGNLLSLWAGITLLVSCVAWVFLLRDSRRLLWTFERLTGQDLDGDQVVGKPEERLILLNAATGQKQAHQRALVQEQSEFTQFVRRLDVFGTSQRTWEPEIGRANYVRYRDALLRLGWAEWNSVDSKGQPNERQGWSLTLPATEIVKKIDG
jgi:hypothetical protein